MTTSVEQPAVMAHGDLYPGIPEDDRCPGRLREFDRDGRFIYADCDACGHQVALNRLVNEPELRVASILGRSNLPGRFLDVKLPVHDGTKMAREHVGLLLDRWGTNECPRPPFLVGPHGRGKTHLLTRIARLLVERHEVRLRYMTLADLLDAARAAMDAAERGETVQAVFDRAATVPLVVLDDLKELRTPWQVDVVEQLVDRRYRGGRDGEPLPVMGATNVPVEGWPDAFGPRVASRLFELTNPVPVGGPDHRRS